jgi:hypothetical protein
MLTKFALRSNAPLHRAPGGTIMKSMLTFAGTFTRAVLIAAAVFVPATALFSGPSPAPKAAPHSWGTDRHCIPVGGSIITNFGAVDPNTTLGPATGDLAGAVAATLTAPPAPGPKGTVIFSIQHHWVTTAGDNIYFDPAVATTVPIPLSQTRFAFTSYPAHVSGGTGKFAGATGDLTNIGEADLQLGTAIRYSGQVCFAEQDQP